MFMKTLMVAILAGTLVIMNSFALAADQAKEQFREDIYGVQFMTEQEQAKYRKQILSTKTEKEREKIRAQHRVLMQERAKRHGLVIEDDLPASSGGVGSGMGVRGGSGGGQR